MWQGKAILGQRNERPGLTMCRCAVTSQWACLLVREGDQWHHAGVLIQCKMPELIIVESREGVSYTILNPRDVLQVEVKIVLHAKHC